MKPIKFLLIVLISPFLINCSSDDSDVSEPKVTIADFEGSWKAVSAVFTNNSNSSESVEFIVAGGEIRYTMLTGGRVRTWIEYQGEAVDEWDAIARLGSNKTIITTPEESSRPVETSTYELGNDIIVLTNNNARFNFTADEGPEVSATSVITFVPNE